MKLGARHIECAPAWAARRNDREVHAVYQGRKPGKAWQGDQLYICCDCNGHWECVRCEGDLFPVERVPETYLSMTFGAARWRLRTRLEKEQT